MTVEPLEADLEGQVLFSALPSGVAAGGSIHNAELLVQQGYLV